MHKISPMGASPQTALQGGSGCCYQSFTSHRPISQAVFSQHTHDSPDKLFRGAAVLHCSESTDTAAMGVSLGKSMVAAAEPRWKGRTCKEGQQGPLWGQKGEQLTAWPAFTAHHLSSSKGENGRLNGLLGCSLYKGQRVHEITRHPEDTVRGESRAQGNVLILVSSDDNLHSAFF